ncbi:MAG: EVE domain-containing protein [Pseudomonadota bacterium]
MAYWLFKSEPFKWSWQHQKDEGDGGAEWDGIRNYQARNNMREMKLGDKGFFYHSNEGLEVVGIVEVCNEVHPDSTTDDERWECVDVKALVDMPEPVTLQAIKANPKLAEMALVTNTRLSVQPVTEAEYLEVCRMGGIQDPPR